MSTNCICSVVRISTQIPTSFIPSTLLSSLPISSSSFMKFRENAKLNSIKNGIFTGTNGRRKGVIVCGLPSMDPWAPNIDSQSIASQLFAFSLFPYLGFLYFITKSKSAPKLTLFGFYFLLAFVGATIPAGIYGYIFGLVSNSSAFLAKVHYGTSLSNVDWLHGGAESLLTLSNLFVVLGLRKGLREHIPEGDQSDEFSGYKKKKSSS